MCWVWPSSQFEGQSDGSKRNLNGCSSNSRAFSVVASPDPRSKAAEEACNNLVRLVGEMGVHLTEVAPGDPMVPIALPFSVIRSHDPVVDGLESNSEHTSDVSLLLCRNIPQDKPCGRGKVVANLVRKV